MCERCDSQISFYRPRKPMTLIDVVNRYAAATGSVRYAQLSENADYNGHALFANYRTHAVGGARYVGEYYWGQRVVIARGGCEYVLRAMLDEYNRQGRGATLRVSVLPEDAHIARALEFIEGKEPEIDHSSEPDGWKWSELPSARLMEQHGHGPCVAQLINAKTREEYEALRRSK